MQYLLGLAPPEDSSSLEERIVTDKEFYEELSIAEDELIDQYLSGELSDSEREHFENHFLLTPERQRKVRFGRAFNRFVGAEEVLPDEHLVRADVAEGTRDVPKPPPRWRVLSLIHIQNPVVGFALAAAVLVFLFGSSWMIVRNWTQPQPHDILTEVISPGSQTRGGEHTEVRKFSIPSGKDTVRLELELVTVDYQVYGAVLQDDGDTVVIQKEGLKAQTISGRSFVLLDVPAGKLSASLYQVKLKGITAGGTEENAGRYYFTVIR